MLTNLRYISEERTRHGRIALYVKRHGKRIRLRHPPGAPEFVAEYQAALAAIGGPEPKARKGKPAERTFRWLVVKYLAESPAYQSMAPAGRRRRRTILESVCEKHGERGMVIPRERIAAGHAERAAKPAAADAWLKSMQALYTWAVDIGLVTASPAARLRQFAKATDGFHTWSMAEIKTYIDKHPAGTMAYRALMALLFTGLRRSNMVLLGRQHLRDGVMRFRATKNDAWIVMRPAWPLAEALAEPPMASGGDMAILQSGLGKAFASGSAFGNWFKERCTEAGLPHCTPHGLRKAGATIAAEEGASEVMLDAMFGWANQRQSGTYTRTARAEKLATEGFAMIAAALVREGVLPNKTGATRSHLKPQNHGATKTGI